MSEDTKINAKAVCGLCGSDIQGPTEPKPDDVFTCSGPDCENKDTYANVLDECQAYVLDEGKRALQKALKKTARKGKFISITVKTTPVPDRTYRFKTIEV